MAAVNFRPNHPKDKSGKLKTYPVSILVSYYHEGIEVELSTGLKVIPSYWNGSRVTGANVGKINKALSQLELTLLNIHIEHHGKSQEEHEAIVRSTIKGVKPESLKKTVQKKTVIQGVQQLIVQYEQEKEGHTVKKFQSLLNKLTEFNSQLTFEQLDFNFVDQFKQFLYKYPNPVYSGYRIDKEGDYYLMTSTEGKSNVCLFDETVFKYLINLKTLCKWAEKRGYKVNPSYKEWEIIRREYPPITLTKDELEKIESLQLSKSLGLARDYLVLECRTGQRISDLKRLNRNDFNGDVWTFFQKKGNRVKAKQIELPFDPDGFTGPALLILEKYNYNLPKISEQELNRCIKTVCEQAGITQEIYIERWAGNKKIRIPGKKYEFISTHTGKKSFITILAGEGVPVSILSILTGTSQKTIERHYLGRISVSKVRDHLKKGVTKSNMRIAN